MLYVATVFKWHPEDCEAIAARSHVECEVLSLDELADIDAHVVVIVPGLEEVKVTSTVIGIILKSGRPKLSSLRVDFEFKFIIRQSYYLTFCTFASIQRGILIDMLFLVLLLDYGILFYLLRHFSRLYGCQ